MRFFDNITNKKVKYLIVVVGLIVFGNSLFGNFVWDDYTYIIDANLTQGAFFGKNIFNNSGQYRPLTVTYFALLNGIFGKGYFMYHLIQLTLHMVNTFLLFILFKDFFKRGLALFLALIFLVHPLQVESVSYISASASPLFFLCGITALLLTKSHLKKLRTVFFQQLLLFSSILIKETGILFLLLLPYFQFLSNKKNLLKNIVFCFITLITYFLIRFGIGNVYFTDRPLIPIASASFTERIMTMPKALFYYVGNFFLPSKLSINQHWVITSPTVTDFYLPLLFIITLFILLLIVAVIFYKRKKGYFFHYLFFFLWFILGMGLHSQIFPLDMTVADRWFYFSLAGLLGIIGMIIEHSGYLAKKSLIKFYIIIALVVILAFGVRTIIRNADWNTPQKLYTHDIRTHDNFLIQSEFATTLGYEGKFEDALIPAKKSIEYFPYEQNIYNLGYIYERLGKIKEAEQEYKKALQAKSFDPEESRHNITIYIRLANLLLYYDKPEVAKKFINDALRVYPESDRLWLLLSLSEYKLQNHEEALKAAEHAYALSDSDMNRSVYIRLFNNLPIDIIYKN